MWHLFHCPKNCFFFFRYFIRNNKGEWDLYSCICQLDNFAGFPSSYFNMLICNSYCEEQLSFFCSSSHAWVLS